MVSQIRKKKKREERRRKNVLIFTIVVAGAMVLSGFYWFAPNRQRALPKEARSEIPWQTYQVTSLGNSSVLVKIKERTSDLIALPEAREINREKISSLINSSLEGVRYISCEATDFYFLCTFNLERENASSEVKEKLREKFRDKYTLKRGFIANLPINISGTDEIYVIGNLDHQQGDYLRVFLFQKSLGGIIAFEEREIPSGDKVQAKVLNITGYSFSGIIAKNFNLKDFSQELRLNVSQVNYRPPLLLVDKRLDNKTLKELESLNEVKVSLAQNQSKIFFNQSLNEIRKILEEKKLAFSLQNGTISFSVKVEADVKEIEKTMKEKGILKIEVKKNGLVSFPKEVVLNGKIIPIKNSQNFPATLERETKEGDKINISLSVIQFGEQIIPFGAREVEGNQTE